MGLRMRPNEERMRPKCRGVSGNGLVFRGTVQHLRDDFAPSPKTGPETAPERRGGERAVRSAGWNGLNPRKQ
jgi:hypothetical protein